MINSFTETIVSLEDAVNHIGKITGRKRNKNVVIRWMTRGVYGVNLDTIRVGREIYTSREAINLFLNDVAQAKVKNKKVERSERGTGLKKAQIESQARQLGI
tara:strand:- start:827 stop:1132 length:306 start_codon:yes stop_codon:yes gene_type:complete